MVPLKLCTPTLVHAITKDNVLKEGASVQNSDSITSDEESKNDSTDVHFIDDSMFS